MKRSFNDILRQLSDTRKARLRLKLPSWSEVEIQIPSSVNLEQCSSEAAALHKAELLSEKFPQGKRLADLTGGLGVDSWAFAQKFGSVLYNERDAQLRDAVAGNFRRMGVDNVRLCGFDITADVAADAGKSAASWRDALEDFAPDIIYLDPSRRDTLGRKVFRPEDCQPDIVGLLPQILPLAGEAVAVKLSPMADISALCGAFGQYLHEVHVVAVGGEVKELLCLFLKEKPCGLQICAWEDGESFTFSPGEEREACVRYAREMGRILIEPRPVLLKAGAFRLLCERFALEKLAPSTQLYTADVAPQSRLLKSYRVVGTVPLSGANIKAVGREYPHADVTARNIPLKSDELSRRMGLASGGTSTLVHIFGCRMGEENILVVTEADRT